MSKKTLVALVMSTALAMPHQAFAHSGGLDSSGCHAGTEPYHCHRDNDKEDQENALAIVGSLLALWLIYEVIKNMREEDEPTSSFSAQESLPSPFQLGPFLSSDNEIGMALEYTSERFGVMGLNTLTNRSSIGAHWKIEF